MRLDEVRRIIGNAITGCTMGLHSASAAREIRQRVIQRLTRIHVENERREGREPIAERTFGERFSGGSDRKGRILPDDSVIPLDWFSRNRAVDLGGFVYNVMPVGALFPLISKADKEREGFADVSEANRESGPGETAACAEGLARIPEEDRHFMLSQNRPLGYPVLWFTTEAGRTDIELDFGRVFRAKDFQERTRSAPTSGAATGPTAPGWRSCAFRRQPSTASGITGPPSATPPDRSGSWWGASTGAAGHMALGARRQICTL